MLQNLKFVRTKPIQGREVLEPRKYVVLVSSLFLDAQNNFKVAYVKELIGMNIN
jgi:hypothetical protein